MAMKLYIKNMVCDRCKMVVRAELERLGLHPTSVALGEIALQEDTIGPEQTAAIQSRLQHIGFDLIESRKHRITEQVKTIIIELIHRDNDDTRVKHSEYIARQIGMDYAYLSKLFSEVEGTTIEQYTILQRIEKVKELLTYGELTLSEMAYQLGYSSVAALSSQFKKVVGQTPSAYKAAGSEGRKTLDRVAR